MVYMKKLLWSLLSLVILLIIFFALVHSDAYYFADVDGLEIGLYIIIFLWPVAIFCIFSSARAANTLFEAGKSKIGIVAIMIFVLAIILGWPGFGMVIYDKCMTLRIGLLSTKTIMDSKDKAIKHFSKIVLMNNTRQNELIAMLKNDGDSLSNDELWTVLYYLQRNKDPIILKYAVKLGKNNIPRGNPYYIFPLELIIDRTNSDNSQEIEEMKACADETLKDQKGLTGFYSVLKYLQGKKKEDGHLF